jgi:hypothetical protein
MIVRELLAKLGFEVDTKGADKFKQSIGGVQSALRGLASGKILQVTNSLEDSFLENQRKVELLAGPQGLGMLNEAR